MNKGEISYDQVLKALGREPDFRPDTKKVEKLRSFGMRKKDAIFIIGILGGYDNCTSMEEVIILGDTIDNLIKLTS